MSAAEKLRALDEQGRLALKNYAPTHSSAWERQKVFLDLLDALPQLVAVVEAAENVDGPFAAPPSLGEQAALLHLLHGALAELDEQLGDLGSATEPEAPAPR